MINVCVPVLKRYDLLYTLVASLPKGASITIIDNGRHITSDGAMWAEMLAGFESHIHVPDKPMGVAESWNWFIDHVPEDRVIVNDDVTFAPDSLDKLIARRQSDIVFAAGCGFSCFLLRDSCVDKIGVFDESISPGYGYYEDEDYMTRMRHGGVVATDVDCGVVHAKSATMECYTQAEMDEHHRKFHIARANFVMKWGMMPHDLWAKEDAEAKR